MSNEEKAKAIVKELYRRGYIDYPYPGKPNFSDVEELIVDQLEAADDPPCDVCGEPCGNPQGRHYECACAVHMKGVPGYDMDMP